MSLLSRLAVQAARAYGILSAADKTKVVADYLVVAGGGGGGGDGGGGGGAGGLLTSTATLSTLNTYSIAVGAGASGGVGSANGGSGSNSAISGTGLSTITSTGGGGGGRGVSGSGLSGGSGGGGGMRNALSGGAGTSGQGNNGGTGSSGTTDGAAGGGGGSSAVGGSASSTKIAGNGGAGTASSISGSSVTYAGGGGGSTRNADLTYTNGTGGAGGGGNGGAQNSAGSAGTANRGGGGGGGDANATSNGGAGGSGIVIISYTSATPKFVGGTITTSGGKQIHTFTSSGTLSPITPITASYLVVAGGGAGGGVASTNYYGGGGGGAGGLLSGSTTLYSGASYVVTVGAGAAGSATNTRASNGSDSSLSGTGLTTLTSTGGGSGGTQSTNTGASGGSGGGGQNSSAGGSGTSGQGYAGGTAVSGGAGGGGGSSAVGSNGTSSNSGAGGNGTASSITGSSVTYAGGGGGGGYKGAPAINGGSGGTGGGGTGAPSTGGAGGSGTPNSGSGGGGACWFSADVAGGNGGSGTVIISYAGSQQFNGGLVTSSGGNTIHTFTSTGALTPLTNNLNNSLRFRRSASAYLNRTLGTPTNNKIWTYSAWVKRGALGTGTGQTLFGYGVSGTLDSIGFNSSEQLSYFSVDSGGVTQRANYNTSAVFRDPSAWYHIVVAVDTTQATAGNRFKLYVNGNQQTVTTTTALTQNWNTYINSALSHGIGWQFDGTTNYFDGYMTDINFIDGQALEPYYFGNNDANGVWKPILYKGTYGTNGFYLTFGNTTSTTTLGYDSSPNGNNWTCNNISLTAGTTYDAMTDVPTNTSATVANYGVINPLSSGGSITNGNLTFSNSGAVKGCKGSFALESGKWYWENTITTVGATDLGVGIIFNGATDAMRDGTATLTYGVMYQANTNVRKNGTVVANYASYTTGDVIGIAYDADTRSITFYKNNTSQGSITADEPTSPYVALIMQPNTTSATVNANFGQRPFAYTPPTGYVAVNTYNLPTPTILQGNKYMDATTYTATGTSQVIVNQGQFKPDLVWTKARSTTGDNILTDAVRGATKVLYSNLTDAEVTTSTYLTAFNSNGYSVGTGNYPNNTTMVGWQWQAGQGSTSSNTSGSITSTVSVNTTAGFSVVTYTGTGANATVGHGLGVAPSMIFFKQRSGGTARAWQVYHISMGNGGGMYLNQTNAYTADSTAFNNTSPTSSVFTIGSSVYPNQNASPYVAYCWAEIAGFSKFGSYTGNGSADGPFVYLGFRPKFIMIKVSSTINDWQIIDSSRNTYNLAGNLLNPNSSAAESTANMIDFLSNGFKLRNNAATTQYNGSGSTYIYAAFAENPFKNANAR